MKGPVTAFAALATVALAQAEMGGDMNDGSMPDMMPEGMDMGRNDTARNDTMSWRDGASTEVLDKILEYIVEPKDREATEKKIQGVADALDDFEDSAQKLQYVLNDAYNMLFLADSATTTGVAALALAAVAAASLN
mmetsp:Transcript_17517/g.22199  ORF Transcript_17517/g.22199 Transcript_17517/m.22199 type:complete len:136 (-) Transcript_17517:69-476(-)|eukprot:CAMPEP_0170462622 /NCGR_PEP_ID=MMETSP0123-20130129/8063_1 /TAXON_ID=182087 /ORGANISM="Favella ehrenbergii, Strain Fehren 1" /LENGTH=135 /DNA_ID=CAMNT_0010727897 /DNA_START=24 /DNA_END=431 /DNA_ORIENTATION=+